MAMVPNVNQNAASIKFDEITFGDAPKVLQPVEVASGFTYFAKGSLIGTPKATPNSSYFLFDSTDNTQMLFGVTFDNYLNAKTDLGAFAATGAVSTLPGDESPIVTGNIAGSNGNFPSVARSVITDLNISLEGIPLGALVTSALFPKGTTLIAKLSANAVVVSNLATTPAVTGDTTATNNTISNISVSTTLLQVGARITGAGIPVGATIVSIPTASSITISAPATATATGVALTTTRLDSTLTFSKASASERLINVATVQGNTTQWLKSALVGVNGTTDISTYITANPELAREFTKYNGALAIPVVSFNFIGG